MDVVDLREFYAEQARARRRRRMIAHRVRPRYQCAGRDA